MNRRNGPRYQRVLAIRVVFFLTGAIPKGLILREKNGVCVCVSIVLSKFDCRLFLEFVVVMTCMQNDFETD